MKDCAAARPCLHFVGFDRDKNFWQWFMAVSTFGEPDYVHDRWDVRAEQEFCPGDTIVYANRTPRRAEERDAFLALADARQSALEAGQASLASLLADLNAV